MHHSFLSEKWLLKRNFFEACQLLKVVITSYSIHYTKLYEFGCLNRVMTKLIREELFVVEDEKIIPTQKLKDLMPYFLRKERVESIQQFIKGGEDNATN